MTPRLLSKGLAFIFFMTGFALAAKPADAVVASQNFPATLATHPLALDPSLSDPLWATGALPDTTYQNLTTRQRAAFPMTVDLLYDANNLYVGFHAEQGTTPITATQTAHDIGFGIDDFVGIGIDASGNGSQVYFFETTPRGTRYEQASENARYRPQWQAAAAINGTSWNAVMIIPLKAMRISAQATWRINILRGIAAVGEHYTWAYDGIMQDAPTGQWPLFTDARFWPSLSGLKLAGSANAVRPRPHFDPYVLSSTGGNRNLFQQSNGTFIPESIRHGGLDFTYPLTNTINFVGTLFPDFSNVEIDQETIAPQEFRRALQEYRPFFAQGASFLNPNQLPVGGVISPPNQIFYSPGVGPFNSGAKVEGTYGKESFGVLTFRGYNDVGADQFNDTAFGWSHAEPNGSLSYWADGVLAHHSVTGSDVTTEVGIKHRNLGNKFIWGLDDAFEHGSDMPAPGFAHSFNGFLDVHRPFYEVNLDYTDISPNYNPVDGFTTNSDIRGLSFFVSPQGSTPGLKNWNVIAYGDRYLDRSGAVHQADTAVFLNATFKNGWSLNGVGPQVGLLRSYALDDPNRVDPATHQPVYPGGCNDPTLPFSSFTGYPHYFCGTTQRFNFMNVNVGYLDGTPHPIDFGFAEGPFGPNFTHLYSVTTSRPLGSRYSISLEYDGTVENPLQGGAVQSQWLRRVTLGETLGPDANISFSLRAINGLGGFATPGVNFAASYHRRFATGDLYINYGSPAATATLNRLIIKYVFHLGGGGSGT